MEDKIKRKRESLLVPVMMVFLWGLWAHGYGFMHSSFSHDSLSEFDGAGGSNDWKIQLGRFIVPLYKAIFRTNLTLPWLVGLLSLLWIGMAVFLCCQMFRIESKTVIFLIAGIFTTNITVIATAATYLSDFDCDMFAMLCAVGAAYAWKKDRMGWLMGIPLVMVSLGLYQSYISVTIVLIIFSSIFALFDRNDWKTVFFKGLKGIGMLLLGGASYYLFMQIVLAATGISLASGDYNSLDNAMGVSLRSVIPLVYYAYVDCVWRFFSVTTPYPDSLIRCLNIVLCSVSGILFAIGWYRKCVGNLERILCILLLGILPLGMNITYVLTMGMNHDLMVYAIWLGYLLALLLSTWTAEQMKNRKCCKAFSGCVGAMLMIILYANVQTANAAYLKKDMEQDAFLSLMTRVVYRMEKCDGYEAGTTPVVFVGNTEQINAATPGFSEYCDITGLAGSAVTGTTEDFRVRCYFQYVLNNPAYIIGGETWDNIQLDLRVKEMPCYPDDGCIAIVDDILVVKLGEN